MALQYFAESQVDLAVLEVGLGGRFDATNVVSPWHVPLRRSRWTISNILAVPWIRRVREGRHY